MTRVELGKTLWEGIGIVVESWATIRQKKVGRASSFFASLGRPL